MLLSYTSRRLAGVRSQVALLNSRLPSARAFSAISSALQAPTDKKTRNIGIIAHIDAGKTTTTERMLFYAGKTRRIGNVDEGSTVTDFLPAERARGITIQSAVVTLHWHRQNALTAPGPGAPPSDPEHRVNLIDTPGHVDFNFEVIRSLRILDGAVCILDSVAGVEAQTEGVWHQASRHQIPRIIFVNKLDREGASFRNSVLAVAARLLVRPAVCQIPWFDRATNEFCGLVDIVSLRALRWRSDDPNGRSIESLTLVDLAKIDSELVNEADKARLALVELLSDYDDDLVDQFLTLDEDHMAIPEATLLRTLRSCTLNPSQVVVPILCGASFRNVGVQPLLDSVIDFLPSPTDRPQSLASFFSPLGAEVSAPLTDILEGKILAEDTSPAQTNTNKLAKKPKRGPGMAVSKVGCCALAFKVVTDPVRGPLVYVRVYHGSLDRNAVLFNTNLQVSEKAIRLMEMYANDTVDRSSIPTGQIGVISGLKHARTGDTLVSYAGLSSKAGSPGPPAPLDSLQLKPIVVPPPVFFVAIEPVSPSEEKNMWDAISILLREDPSLRVTVDSESGQAQMSGLGELHLEIATDRLINDLKARVTVGPIEIGYRETVHRRSVSTPGTGRVEREVSGVVACADSTAVVSPRPSSDDFSDPSASPDLPSNLVSSLGPFSLVDENVLYIHLQASPTSGSEPADYSDFELPSSIQSAISTGVTASLARGPRASYPIHSTRIDVVFNISSFPTAGADLGCAAVAAALSASSRKATSSALRNLVSPTSTEQSSPSQSSSSRSYNSVAPGSHSVGFMEPVMLVHLTVDESDMGNVIHDLASARGGQVLSLAEGENAGEELGGHDNSLPNRPVYTPPDLFASSVSNTLSSPSRQKLIVAKVPLSEMVGYNRHLRSLTRGRGAFSMQVDRFERMNPLREKKFLASTTAMSDYSSKL